MSATNKRIGIENFYSTSITQSGGIIASWDLEFTVANPPQYTRGFLIIDPTDSVKRERVYYHNVVGTTIYVHFANRTNPQDHNEGAAVQMNDMAEIFNFLQSCTSSTGYVEKVNGLDVIVWWGPLMARSDNTTIAAGDKALTLVNWTTNYIYFDLDEEEYFSTLSIANIAWPEIARVVCAGWNVSSIDYVYTRVGRNGEDGAKGDKWDKGDKGDIGAAAPEQAQTVNDNVLVPVWATVTHIDWVSITVTLPDWKYTVYGLTWVTTYDENNNVLTYQALTGTYWTDWITYDNWMFINEATWYVSLDAQLAYRNMQNTFTAPNIFNSDATFAGRVSFPFYNIGSQAWNFSYDAQLWMAQKVTITWSSAHVLEFNNLAQGTYILFVVQSWTWTLQFNVNWSTNGSITSAAIINASFVNPQTIWPGTHIYTILAAETKAHIAYTGNSI